MPKFEQMPPAAEEEKKFDYEAALNNKDFLDFRAGYPEGESVSSDPDVVERQYHAFENKEAVAFDMMDLYKKELESGFGIKLNKTNLEAVDAYLQKEALMSPERIAERAAELEAYTELKKEKAELEKEIVALGGEKNLERAVEEIGQMKEAAKKEGEVAKWATGWRGFLNPKNSELVRAGLWAISGGRETEEQAIRSKYREAGAIDRFKYLKELGERGEKLSKNEAFLKSYPTIKEATDVYFGQLRKELFENFEPAKAIVEEAASAIGQELRQLLIKENGATEPLKILEKTHGYVEKLKASQRELPVGDLKNLDLNFFQHEVDERFESAVAESVAEIIRDFKIGNKPLDDMRKELKQYLSRPTLGSKDRARTKIFMWKTLNEEIARLQLEKPKGYQQKLTLLKVIADETIINP